MNPPTGNLESGSGNSFGDEDGLVTNLIATPRVGGQHGKVFWIGGSNITLPVRPKSDYALRPEDYKGLMNTEDTCKAGLSARFRLDVRGKNTNVNLTSWIDYILQYMEERGMDTVFRILNSNTTRETYLLEDWGVAKIYIWFKTGSMN